MKKPKLQKDNPVYMVQAIPIEKVFPNSYNPNAQQSNEIVLLYRSILEDGYTQPIVCIKKWANYEIVDGFHRYRVMKEYKDIYEANNGMLPVVVIEGSESDRMASTVRHNRARGKHSSVGMTNIVEMMIQAGETKDSIMGQLGMTEEEYKRLVISNGILKQYEDVDYSMAWETKKMVLARQNYVKTTKN